MKKQQLAVGMMTFEELRAALDALPDQTAGDPWVVSNIGEPYVEFRARALARPGDEALVERLVVDDLVRQLNAYFYDKDGRIYWRERLEVDRSQCSVVVRLDATGEDVDFVTNTRCVMDKNWVRIAGYCRLVRAKAATVDVVDAQRAA